MTKEDMVEYASNLEAVKNREVYIYAEVLKIIHDNPGITRKEIIQTSGIYATTMEYAVLKLMGPKVKLIERKNHKYKTTDEYTRVENSLVQEPSIPKV
jgi:hypothetical protein